MEPFRDRRTDVSANGFSSKHLSNVFLEMSDSEINSFVDNFIGLSQSMESYIKKSKPHCTKKESILTEA
ncbi:Cation proton exchanger [Corchorus olitorius]|uniref:Cation proton exchanger n=1 Tax=Corchorus olitorius TaxID=93759 RepID=A0A1R3FUT7_9ROSI|nr:Cation proton exchanger [Corchorus olitorius]